MAEILRDVLIKQPITQGKNIIIKGDKGGELRFSLAKGFFIAPVHSGHKKQPLLVNCYRTEDLHYIDVSDYNGNRDEIIKVIINGVNRDLIKGIMLYIIFSEKGLIEYGKMKQNGRRGFNRFLFEYKTRISHPFREIKIICFEGLNL